MAKKIRVIKTGDSYYLLLPKTIVEYFDISIFDEYEINASKNKIIFRKIGSSNFKKLFNYLKGGIFKSG